MRAYLWGRPGTGRSVAAALLAAIALAPAGPVAGDPEGRPTGERIHGPETGGVYVAFRDAATGLKWWVAPDGSRLPDAAAVAAREAGGLSPADRVLDPALRAVASDPTRADAAVQVVAILRRQPVVEAGAAARRRHGPAFTALMDRMRGILASVAPERAVDPGRTMDLGARVEEERRLLGEERWAELAALRASVADLKARFRREVLDEGRAAALEDQAPLVARVEAVPGARVLARSVALSTVTLALPAGAIRDLVERSPEIASLRPVQSLSIDMDTALGTMGASSWTGAGYDGSSSTHVAVLDTGIDGGHPALSGVVSASAVFLSVASGQSNFNDNSSSTDDLQFHGTHVGGIVASTDSTYRGVMPGGRLLNAKCGYRNTSGGGSLTDPDIMSAGDWAVDNGADVLNCSFGGGGTTNGNSALALFFDAIPFSLLTGVVVAAGNAGSSSGTVGIPGDGFNVITVGNFDDNGTTTHSDNSLASSSSRGPLSDGRRKPDLSAPGTNIASAYAFWEGGNPDFVSATGTSMASPATAGAAGILEDFAASWTPESVKALLCNNTRNASPYPTSPDNHWGTGGIDLAEAYLNRAAVKEGTLSSSGPSYVFLKPNALAAGARATLCWNRHVTHNNASTPSSYASLIDLDLYAYDEADGSLDAAATSSLDTVEQVKLPAALSAPILKVDRYGSFPSGVTTEWWSVAVSSTGGFLTISDPNLACTFTTAPAYLASGQQFTVSVRVDNSGGIAAQAPSVTLGLPPGYSVVSGANPQTVARIAAAGSATATWTVKAATGPSGSRTLTATATSNSYGETFTSPTRESAHLLDVVAPSGSVTVDGGAAWRASATGASLALSATDDLSGVVDMRIGNTTSGSTWEPYAGAKSWNLAAGADGTRTVVVEFRDRSGNVSASTTDTIGVDTTAPTGSVTVADGAAAVGTTSVAVAFTTSDGSGSGVADVRLSNDGTTWSPWTPIASTNAWTLAGPDGTKTVRAQFRDAVGNVSSTVTDAVLLDTAAPSGSVTVADGAAWTTVRTVSLGLAATDGGAGVAEMRFSNDGTSWSPWYAYDASHEWTLAPGDGAKTVHAQFRDAAGNASDPATDGIGLDGTAPAGSVTAAGGAAWVNASPVAIAVSASDAGSGLVEMRLSDDGVAWDPWGAYAQPPARAVGAPEGAKAVYAQFRDVAGNVSTTASDGFGYDVTPPGGSIALAGGAAWVSSTATTLSLDGTDAHAGVVEFRVSHDGTTWGEWTPAATSLPWTLSGADGTKTAYAQFRDAAGNVSSTLTDTVGLDRVAPSGTVTVAGGAAWTSTASVVLDLSAADGASGVTEMRLRDAGGAWTAWMPYATTGAWTLGGGDGVRTVEAAFRDAAGNVSATASDSIGLDTTPPTRSLLVAGGAAYAASVAVTLDVSAADAGSGPGEMRFRNAGGAWGPWTPCATTAPWTLAAGDGVKTVGMEVRDVAGNVAPEITDAIGLDTTPPTADVQILAGRAATNGAAVTLDLSFADNLSGVAGVRASDDGADWGPWTAATATLAWTLPGGEGERTVHVQVRDAAGNVSPAATDAILLDVTPPTGSFALADGAAWLMPWEPLRAHTTSGDGPAGSGVGEFRWSHDGGSTWGPWTALPPDGIVTATRPEGRGPVDVAGQFRDVAGNVSATVQDRVHLVEDSPANLSAVRVLAGAFDDGDDVDAFVLDLRAGDLLTLKVKTRAAEKRGELRGDLDLYAPDGARLVAGAYPPGTPKGGVAKLPIVAGGRHWIVLRPAGAAAAAGGTYALTVAPKIARSSLAPSGITAGEPVAVEVVNGSILTGSVTGAFAVAMTATPPGGEPLPVAAAVKGIRAVIRPTALVGPSGTWLVHVSDGPAVRYRLKVKPPPRVPAVE